MLEHTGVHTDKVVSKSFHHQKENLLWVKLSLEKGNLLVINLECSSTYIGFQINKLVLVISIYAVTILFLHENVHKKLIDVNLHRAVNCDCAIPCKPLGMIPRFSYLMVETSKSNYLRCPLRGSHLKRLYGYRCVQSQRVWCSSGLVEKRSMYFGHFALK